ncbi:hypothetical protein P4C99_20235 [Pontiellaceae bacterium B1224]|nr:hypothetical protein [Pontiellaceae bacterium B1224]
MKRAVPFILCAGWLAVSPNAPAEIIWSGDQNLTSDYQYIDLNFDSLIDVFFDYSVSGDLSGQNGQLLAYVDGFSIDGSNRILVSSSNGRDAALPYDTLISGSPDSSLEWGSGNYFAGIVSYWVTYPPPDEEWRGLLGENGNAYFGIEFEVEGATHYGWVNIVLGPEENLYGFEDPITASWAYESTPGAGIVAGAIPEPSTGILTVGGSLALLFLARSRRCGKHVGVIPRKG